MDVNAKVVVPTLVLGIALGVGAGLWVYHHVTFVLRVGDEVPVEMHGTIPFRAQIEQQVDVGVDQELTANVRLGRLEIPIDESIEIPLELSVRAPIATEVQVDQPLDIALKVPIDLVLTEKELDLSKLEIPIDTDIFIDDVLPLDLVVPIDTEVKTTLGVVVPVKANVPVKMKVPIRQKVHVRDTLKLGIKTLRVPLKVVVPVQARIPFKQKLAVTGEVTVPIRQRLKVPLKQVLHPDLSESIPTQVRLGGKIPAQLKASLDANVTVDQAIRTKLGAVRIEPADVTVETR